MELRQLRYFVAVAEERNFTRAAEKLHIAQPPLSRQIQLLEEELGVTLISRATRPLRLTDAGRLFNEQALQILGRVEQLKLATQRVGKQERRVLSIGFVASALYGGVPALVRELRKHAPELDIQLLEMMSSQQIEALKTGRIDIGFGRVRKNDPAVVRTVLREERMVLAVAPGTRLAESDAPVRIEEMAGEELVIYPRAPRPSFADQVLALLEDHGVRPTVVHEVSEMQTALGLVAAEVGVCLVPYAGSRHRADLKYRLIADQNATSPVILSHRRNDDSPYIGLVKELLQELYAGRPEWVEPDPGPS
ncbi:LysR family transcriptional regulator [Novilysobacter defluvii]|uniref:LysR family transcriptional regulator n=1 Tax=Lysobacter defluvii IMMIB APB-9 = DSM 18482 TaxID=1385515 RepID=A0A0A0MAP7_9GAMM|nr:LysR family transcriptional regulator [Lysobacter defluvii]KGO99232.1 LysR family transcriptional regulator [Lysobacter defluvii IMMIB APB-9 = DSM 18482]